ncbi:L-iditol 2-dehydrogenase [Natronincola peptidivorans]|uniref:L-iditol 2-dehydrogenase n=1 Tax=Natronincola peptidivorans TaxID=426128 RepID=A0A1I0CFJ2_9FIRM|nr:zinc-binding dehydrogenase [Natronincola peptidivorans]SET18338.1 L-iditol 2-dehydrogenase [Natronincola peptidivorans]
METNQVQIEAIIKQVLMEMQGTSNSKEGINNNQRIPNTCKAAVLTDIQKIEVKEFPIPTISEDEILVKVEGCGVCGTDLHEYKGDPFNLIPVVLGHEGTGEIVKLGKNVKIDSAGKPVKIGDKIVTSVINKAPEDAAAVDPSKSNLLEDTNVYGLLPDDEYHLNGWFGEYIVLRKNSTFFQVNDMNLNQRLLIEPAAVVIHAVERAKTTGLLKFNSTALVQGCGPIGLLLIAVLKTMGVLNIIAIDGDDQRLAMAKGLGATKILNFKNYRSTEELISAVKEITTGKGCDFAFQCTGVPQAASNIWKFVKRGGGLCEVGFFVDNGDCTINPHWDICQKEITVVGSWIYTIQDYPTTFDFLKRANEIGLPVEELITHRFSLEELNEAMEVNMRLEGIKVAYVNNR